MRRLALVLLIAAPASARVSFAAWDGPPQIFTGEGGTKIDNHGVEVWTAGRPARRFQVLGVISDERADKLLSGDAMSSSSIAKKVREVGGDALVLFKRDAQASGFTAGGSTFGNSVFGGGRVVHDVSTRFVVVKYLDPQ